MSKLGLDCKLYRNTASWASPTWDLVDCVDVTVNLDRNAVAAPSRASAWNKYLPGLKNMSLDVKLNADPADTDQAALQAAYEAGTVIGMAVADGAIATSGTKYLKGDYIVTKFQRGEPLEGVVPIDVTLQPAASSVNDPTFVTVGS